MAEGTVLNNGVNGDTISDEDVTGQPRLGGIVPSVPTPGAGSTTVKLERTKISVGTFGVDGGDATPDNGLPVSDEWTRQLLEGVLTILGGAEAERVVNTRGDASSMRGGISLLDVLLELLQQLQQLNRGQRVATGEVRYTAVNASTTAATLVIANPLRQGCVLYNDRTVGGAGTAYVMLWDGATTLSTANNTAPLVPGAYYEVPFGFRGRIDVIWDSAIGNIHVTELM